MASTISPSFAKIVAAISCTVAFCAIAGSSNISFIFAEIVSRSRGSRRYRARYFTACNCDGESSGISSRTNCCYFIVSSLFIVEDTQNTVKTLFCRRLSHRERERVREREVNARQNRERSLSPVVQFFQTTRACILLKSSSNHRHRFATGEKNEKTNSFASSLVERSTKRERERNKNKASNVPDRTPTRCTIDRRNNPSLLHPRRITSFRWNPNPRLRLSRLGTRLSGTRCKLGRANPFLGACCVSFYVCFARANSEGFLGENSIKT